MYLDFENFYKTIFLDNPFAVEMYVCMGVTGCGCSILLRVVRIGYVFWALLKRDPTSASVADPITFLVMFGIV